MKRRARKKRAMQLRATSKRTSASSIDWSLLIVTLVLLLIGVVMVYEASLVEAAQQFDNKFYFAQRQLQWAVLGVGVLCAGILVPIHWVKKQALPIFILSLILLVIVLFSRQIGGARRWIDLGFFALQPSEVAKLAIIIYLSALFEKTIKFTPFILSLLMVIGLIMLQPDLGTSIVLASIAFTLYFIAGAPLIHLAGMGTLAILSAATLIVSSPYRLQRLMTFLDINRDPQGASYHIKQIIIGLGSGGLFGQGLGRSLQKYRFLPEATTDSIFAVIAEETGFLGTIIVMSLYLFFTYKGIQIALHTKDTFMKLMATGITVLIISQAFLNLSAMGALVPLTGITLPFISYGGSSLLVSLAATGLLINISRYKG